MQIFVLDANPQAAARMLCDTHLRKMCLETSQILSGVVFLHGLELVPGMLKTYNIHHPVIKSVNTPEKIRWVLQYNDALHREYIRRFGKIHACSKLRKIYKRELLKISSGVPACADGLARVFKDVDVNESDLVQAHRLYYCYKKSVIKNFNYSRRPEPEWLNCQNNT